jgi:hypothetical protein
VDNRGAQRPPVPRKRAATSRFEELARDSGARGEDDEPGFFGRLPGAEDGRVDIAGGGAIGPLHRVEVAQHRHDHVGTVDRLTGGLEGRHVLYFGEFVDLRRRPIPGVHRDVDGSALRAIPAPIMPPAPRIATAFIVTFSPVFVIGLVYIETVLPAGAKHI